jgi:hypothetical protein
LLILVELMTIALLKLFFLNNDIRYFNQCQAKTIDTTHIMTNTTLTHECSTIVVLMFILKNVVSINAMTLKQICEMC